MIFRDNFGQTQTTRGRGTRALARKQSGEITLKFSSNSIENTSPVNFVVTIQPMRQKV